MHFEVSSGVLLALMASGALLWWLVREGPFELAVGMAIIVALICDAVIAHRAVSRSQLELTPPSVIEAGTPSVWAARRTGSRRPVSVRLLVNSNTQDVLAVDERRGEVVVPPMWRGTVPFIVADLTARGPLGLIEAGRRVVLSFNMPIPVVPRGIPQENPWPKFRSRGFGLREGSPVGDDTVRTIRPYVRGDERRRVHWKSTARHGQLMVRECDGLGVVRVRIVVELGPAGNRAEYVAGAAHWLIDDAQRRGWSVELVALDGSAYTPSLAAQGYTFGPLPRLEPVIWSGPPTVSGPVRGQRELHWRLATMGFGSPELPHDTSPADITCRVTPRGVEWS